MTNGCAIVAARGETIPDLWAERISPTMCRIFVATDIHLAAVGTGFRGILPRTQPGAVPLAISRIHNVSNSLVANCGSAWSWISRLISSGKAW